MREKMKDKNVHELKLLLKNVLVERFSIDGLRDLCYDLDIDYLYNPELTKPVFAQMIINYQHRRKKIKDLVDLIKRKRPDIAISEIDALVNNNPVARTLESDAPTKRNKLEKSIIIIGFLAIGIIILGFIFYRFVTPPNASSFPYPVASITASSTASFTPLPTFTSPPAITSIPSIVPLQTATPWPLIDARLDEKINCNLVANPTEEAGIVNAVEIIIDVPFEKSHCSWVVNLNGFDASQQTVLTFMAKGGIGGEQFLIGVKDTVGYAGNEIKVTRVVTNTWEQIRIPLEAIQGQDLSSLENLSLGFEYEYGNITIYVADFVFEEP